MKGKGMGHVTSDERELDYCGQDALKRNGVAFICNNKLRRCVVGFNQVNDNISTIRIQCKPITINCSTSIRPDIQFRGREYRSFFYETVGLLSVIYQTASGDMFYIIGDWNAKFGKYISNYITGNFGLGERKSEVINL